MGALGGGGIFLVSCTGGSCVRSGSALTTRRGELASAIAETGSLALLPALLL